MPTQEDWQQLLRRLEAVERLAMELLQRVQRLEFKMGIKAYHFANSNQNAGEA